MRKNSYMKKTPRGWIRVYIGREDKPSDQQKNYREIVPGVVQEIRQPKDFGQGLLGTSSSTYTPIHFDPHVRDHVMKAGESASKRHAIPSESSSMKVPREAHPMRVEDIDTQGKGSKFSTMPVSRDDVIQALRKKALNIAGKGIKGMHRLPFGAPGIYQQ